MKQIKETRVLLGFTLYATALIFLLAAGLLISNSLLLNRLSGAYRDKIGAMYDTSVFYVKEREDLYAAIAKQVVSDANSEFLSLHNGKYSYKMFKSIIDLKKNLQTLKASNPEIADVILWYDNLGLCVYSAGTWNRNFISGLADVYGMDLSLISSKIGRKLYTTENYLSYYAAHGRSAHVFIILHKSAVETMLSRLMPPDFGAFVVESGSLRLTNIPGGYAPSRPPDIVSVDGEETYSFYYDPATYSASISRVAVFTIAAAALLIGVAYIIMVRIKKTVYDPIPKILEILNKDQALLGERRKAPRWDEFTIIEDAIVRMNTSISEYKDILRNADEIYRCIELNSMVSGAGIPTRPLMEIFSRDYCCLTVLFEDENGDNDALCAREFAVACERFSSYPVYSMHKYSVFFFFFENSDQYTGFIHFLSNSMRVSRGFAVCGASERHTGTEDIRVALEESLTVFQGMPTDGLNLAQKLRVYGEGQECENPGCKVSFDKNYKLITAAMLGNAQKIRNAMWEILEDNQTADLYGKRKLILYMYDTACLVANCDKVFDENALEAAEKTGPEHQAIGNIYNPSILFERICELLEAHVKAVRDDDAAAKADVIFNYINENLHRDISLSDLADTLNISYSYASSFFKNIMRTNFLDFLQKQRVLLSLHLLTTTDKSIEEIAAAVGFTSANTFFRVFKKYVGTSPGAYRKEGGLSPQSGEFV